MIGHSVGEYVAAHLAGVFSLEDALALVAERGRLMQSVPPGAMLAVPLGEAALRPLLPSDLDLASINSPSACVVAGPAEAVARLEAELASRGVAPRRLQTSHAFHSAMMEAVLPAFVARVRETKRHRPKARFVSNVSGTWISEAEAVDPEYWGRHLRSAVHFSHGVRTLLEDESKPVLLEVGPGNTLASLARQQKQGGGTPAAVTSLRHPRETQPDRAFLLGALGKLWLAGVRVDWTRVHSGERRRRIEMPAYPFERQRYWVEPNRERQEMDSLVQGFSLRRREVQDWFYQPSWRQFLPAELLSPPSFPEGGSSWLLFLDEDATGFGPVLAEQLAAAGQTVVTVRAGRGFAQTTSGFEVDPRQRADYVALLKALFERGQAPRFIVHLWGLSCEEKGSLPADRVEAAQARGFYSLLFLAQALGRVDLKKSVSIGVVTDGMVEVVGGELTCPEKATVLGPCRVIPQELKDVVCLCFDVDLPAPGSAGAATLARRIVAELVTGQLESLVAYRGPYRWVLTGEPMPLPPPDGANPLRERGVYLITGGLGGIGLVFARHLAERWKARLVLTGRSPVPPADEWTAWLAAHDAQDATSSRIRDAQEIASKGGEVLYLKADVASREDMDQVVAAARERFGPIQGVIHAAGVAGGGIIQLKEPEVAARVMAPKVQGTFVLQAALKEEPLDFLLLCSSTAAFLGGFGQVDYCGANAFLDAFAHWARAASGPPTLSVNWDAWREVGMAVNTFVPGALQAQRDYSLKTGIAPAEGVDALGRILAARMPQLAVFTMDIRPGLLRAQVRGRAVKPPADSPEAVLEDKAADATEHGLASDLERTVAEVWERTLGRKQIGVNDNFFELGGDSLTALQVIALLKAHLGRDIPIVAFYEAPTVGLLARALGDGAPAKLVALDDVEQRAGTRLELMQRRRQKRGAPPALDAAR